MPSLVALADDGYWSKAGGGSWPTAANWDSGTIADGTDNSAYFGFYSTIPASAGFTLDGQRTIGNIYFTDTEADSWTLNTGSGGPLILDSTFDTSSISVLGPSQVVTINTIVAGTNGLEKLGTGTLVLGATNTYTGPTVVTAGALRINGQTGSDSVTVASGGVLGGAGAILAPVTIQSGGTLAPSNSFGTFLISNTLTLLAGSTNKIHVKATTSAHETIAGMASVTYGGTLVASNDFGSVVLGQRFPIFSAGSSTGIFTRITPNPGPGLRWRFDPGSGVLSVVSSASQPVISGIALLGTNAVLRLTNGPPGATAYLLSSTNVSVPVTNWTRLASSAFDVSGNLVLTNAVNPAQSQQFFVISTTTGP